MIKIFYTNRIDDIRRYDENTFKSLEDAVEYLIENGYRSFGDIGYGKVLKENPMGNERYEDANFEFHAE